MTNRCSPHRTFPCWCPNRPWRRAPPMVRRLHRSVSTPPPFSRWRRPAPCHRCHARSSTARGDRPPSQHRPWRRRDASRRWPRTAPSPVSVVPRRARPRLPPRALGRTSPAWFRILPAVRCRPSRHSRWHPDQCQRSVRSPRRHGRRPRFEAKRSPRRRLWLMRSPRRRWCRRCPRGRRPSQSARMGRRHRQTPPPEAVASVLHPPGAAVGAGLGCPGWASAPAFALGVPGRGRGARVHSLGPGALPPRAV